MPEAGRASDHLANERTLLAWVRTAIAIIVFGFAVGRFGLALRQIAAAQGAHIATTGASLWFGSASILMGLLLMIAALVRYRRTSLQLESGEYRPSGDLVTIVSAAILVFGCALIAYLVATQQSLG
jgi:putative membrane protein